MASEFETSLMRHLENDELTSQEKKLKKWLAARPNGPLRRKAIKQLGDQADAVLRSDDAHGGVMFSGASYSEFQAIDWMKLLDMLGPLIKLIISLFS